MPGARTAAQNAPVGTIRCREGDGVAGRVLQIVETPREIGGRCDVGASSGQFTCNDFDQQGSVVAIADPSGDVVTAYGFPPFTLSRQIITESQTGDTTLTGDTPLNPINYGANNLGQKTLNQVTSVVPPSSAAVPFLYDAGGDLTSDGYQTYTYDKEGDGHLLTSGYSQSPSGTPYATYNPTAGFAQTYSYDPFGRRYAMTAQGYTTIYVHDDQDREIAEYDGASGTLWQDNVFDAHDRAPVTEILTPADTGAGYQPTFLLFDIRGTVVKFSPGSGWAAEPNFGTTAFFNFPDYGYAGYRFDDATQLYYTRNRYYAPYPGRFLTPDPIGQAGGLNLYAYVGNDPINNVDPSGLVSEAEEDTAANLQVGTSIAVSATAAANVVAPRANAFVNGAYSVIPGVGDAIYQAARGTGVLGPQEFQNFDVESQFVGDVVTTMVQHPQATYTVATDILSVLDQDPLFRYYVAGRLAFGFATGLGPAASLGNTLQAVQNGHNVVDSIIQNGFSGLSSTGP